MRLLLAHHSFLHYDHVCMFLFILGNKCFGVFGVDGKDTKTWEEAHAFCQTQQGIKPDLASVNSPAENGKSKCYC